MGPLAAIALGKQILRLTGLDDKIGDWLDDKTGGAAAKVVEIAEAVTGGPIRSSDIVGAETVDKIRADLLAAESEIRQLAQQDRADARRMYRETDHGMADHIARRVIEWNLPMILLLALGNVVALICITEPAIGVAVGNALGASISYLWQERRTVIEFFFGSSQGSKDKTKAIAGVR